MTSANEPANSSPPVYKTWRFAFWAVLLLSFVLYIPSLGNLPVWDDIQILNGEGIGGNTIAGAIAKPFLGGYFRPLVAIVLQAENAIFQGNTFLYHLVN